MMFVPCISICLELMHVFGCRVYLQLFDDPLKRLVSLSLATSHQHHVYSRVKEQLTLFILK